jgi:hypothetical protein
MVRQRKTAEETNQSPAAPEAPADNQTLAEAIAAQEHAIGYVAAPPKEALSPQTPQTSGGQATLNVKKPYTLHRPWAHDNLIGVEANTYMSTEHGVYEARVQFRDGAPAPDVRQLMKDNGFKWEKDREPGPNFGQPGAWVRKIAYDGAQDRLALDRTYAAVVQMMREAKGAGQSR